MIDMLIKDISDLEGADQQTNKEIGWRIDNSDSISSQICAFSLAASLRGGTGAAEVGHDVLIRNSRHRH